MCACAALMRLAYVVGECGNVASAVPVSSCTLNAHVSVLKLNPYQY